MKNGSANMDSELQASPDAPTASMNPAELPSRPTSSPSVAAAGAIGALFGAIVVVAAGDAVWTGKTDASKLSLDIAAAHPGPSRDDAVSALGTVELDPEHVATVILPGRGFVQHVASFEGDRVSAGSLLAVIQSERTVRDPAARYELVSPIEGTVVERALQSSENVTSETLAFRVADLDHLKVGLRVKGPEAKRVRIGDEAVLSPLAANELSLHGSVTRVSGTGDVTLVSVHVVDRHHHLREGDTVRAHLVLSSASGAPSSM